MALSSLFTENDYNLYVNDLVAKTVTVTDTVDVARVVVDSGIVGRMTALSYTQGPVERSPISNQECWMEWGSIPSVPPLKSPWPGTVSGVVSGIKLVPLGQNPADPLQFGYTWSAGAAPPYDKFSLMVPADMGDGAYTPTLRDDLGAVIPYNPTVWVADGLLQIVEFQAHPPSYYGFTAPLYIDYWQYVGEVATNFSPANEGSGAQVFDTTTEASFRSIVGSEADGIKVRQDPSEIFIDCTLVGQNLLADGPTVGNVYSTKTTSALLQFRSLVAGSGVTLSQDATSVTISSTGGGGGGISGLSNEGSGAGVYDTLVGSTAVLKSLSGTANGLVITPGTDTITIDNTLDGQNLGTAPGGPYGVFSSKVGAKLQFNSVNGSTDGIAISGPVGGVLTISNNLTAQNLGTGVGTLFSAKSGAALQFNSLAATGSVSVSAPSAGVVTISSSAITTLANEGSGAQVWDSATAATLRSITQGSGGISVTQGATTITVDNTLTGQSNGTGAGVIYSGKSGSVLQFNSIAAGVSGISVSVPSSGTVTIDNTLTGQNLAGGTGLVFQDKVGSFLRFNSLAGSGAVSVSAAVAGVITISSSAITSLSNEGAGAQVYDTGTSSALRTILGTTNGISVTQNATTITIDNTLSGSNLGSGAGIVYSGKSGASLQFNSLAGGAGMSVSAPSSGTITITNTAPDQTVALTAGTGITTSGTYPNFTITNSAPDQTVTITAGAGITVSGGYPNFTISATSAAPMSLPVNTQFFAANGTYDKAAAVAAGATKVTIIISGGGGGGGSGSVGSTSNSINGGGGGAGGAISIVTNVPISLLGAAEAFVSGAGGAGAAGVTAAPGNAGSSGSRSTFFMYGADGGSGGVGGTNPSGGGSVTSNIQGSRSLIYNAGTWDPTYQTPAITESAGSPYNGGGGGGSCVDSNNVTHGGVECSSPTVEGAYLSATPASTLGAAGNGANATTPFYTYYGVGGAGGSGNGAFKGGNGLQGGGGGGGSARVTGGTSGAGGAGGAGWLLVYAFA